MDVISKIKEVFPDEDWEANTFPRWDFQSLGEGAQLIGEVANIGEINFGDRKVKRVIIRELGTDKKLSVLLTSVLESAFTNLNIKLGDIVRITYLGMVKSSQTKRAYHNFMVEKKVEREGRVIN